MAHQPCWICLVRGERREGAYIWTGHFGASTVLCIECCAEWRANAAKRQKLPPQRVCLLSVSE